MSAPQWQPGTLYPPGSLVVPLTLAPIQSGNVTNYSFASGATGWTLGGGFAVSNAGGFDDTWRARFTAAAADATNNDVKDINPGCVISASCRVFLEGPSTHAGGSVVLDWFDSGMVFISRNSGNSVDYSNTGYDAWRQSSVVATAPVGATKVRIGCSAFRVSGTAGTLFDAFVWDWTYTPPDVSTGISYKATQADSAFSASIEPVWPAVTFSVVDGGVTWLGTTANRVLWQTSPLLKSGAVEPTWPTAVGGQIVDGTMAWEVITGQILDDKCPHSKIVAIAASKVFAADNDIISFCATVNPLDWTTPNDAGYIPFGLNTHGSTPATALGLYRSNLVIFNDEGYQMWQVDEDPANNAILDASPVDCPYTHSVQGVSNDLLFLSARGIRSIGIAGASTNLQAGYFGAQIDPLVLAAIKAQSVGEFPVSLFWPGAGQYWLIFGNEAFVLTMNGGPKDQSWSRYTFPSDITDWAILGTELYLRSGTYIWRVSEDALTDDTQVTGPIGGNNTAFHGEIWWPYLDFGALGVDKQLEGFDLVITGNVTVRFGYNQNNTSQVTTDYAIVGDTLPGTMIPMPLTAPSFQIRLIFDAGQTWEWMATNMYANNL